jgi:hypothetical protein
MLVHVAGVYWENGSMPKRGEAGFKWLQAQKKLISDRKMAVERMQRVREEGGAVEAVIMNERTKAGWGLRATGGRGSRGSQRPSGAPSGRTGAGGRL